MLTAIEDDPGWLARTFLSERFANNVTWITQCSRSVIEDAQATNFLPRSVFLKVRGPSEAAITVSLGSWIAALILLDRAPARGTKAAARNFFIVIAIFTVWAATMPIDDQAANLRTQCGIPYIGSLAISCLIYAPMLGVLLTWLIFRGVKARFQLYKFALRKVDDFVAAAR